MPEFPWQKRAVSRSFPRRLHSLGATEHASMPAEEGSFWTSRHCAQMSTYRDNCSQGTLGQPPKIVE